MAGPSFCSLPVHTSKRDFVCVLERFVMDLRQLEYFVTVVKEASFTKAAAKLRVAQPGVSAQMRRLEDEVGAVLLDRSRRTVKVTQVGAAVLPHARAALDAVASARRAADEFNGLIRGHVAVGMVTSCAAFSLPTVLSDFHRAHSGIEVTLSEANSDQLIESLASGHLDVALIGSAGPSSEDIATTTVADEPLVAAVGLDDPLARRALISLQAIRERAFISLPRGTGLRRSFDDACAALGFEPRVAFEASNLEMLLQLARRGLGVAILPESAAKARPSEVRAITLTTRLRGRIELAWRAEGPSSPAARAFLDHARKALTPSARPPADRAPSSPSRSRRARRDHK